MLSVCLVFYETATLFFQSGWASLQSHQKWLRIQFPRIFSSIWWCHDFFMSAVLTGVYNMVLIASDSEHLFMFVIRKSGEMPVCVLCPFSKWIFCFHCWVLRVLFVFQILVLCQICGLRIFPPCCSLSFSPLSSLSQSISCNLMRSNVSIFLWW